jgi:hypothetical protein
MDDAVDRGSRGTVRSGDLAQALAAAAIAKDCFPVEIERPATYLTALEPGPAHSGPDPLGDQATFQFGDRADDDHDGPAQRAAGVDLFAEADELDLQSVEFIEHFQEVTRRTSDTIARPDQDNIESAAAGIAHHFVQARPAGLRSRYPVSVLVDDLEAALRSHLAQIEQLAFRVLIDALHPGVHGGAFHCRRLVGLEACLST